MILELIALLQAVPPKPDTARATVTAVIADDAPKTPFFFGSVSGLAIDAAGRVYVTDAGEARIAVFSTSGAPITTIGRKGKGPGEFQSPTGPVFGGDGALYVRNMSAIERFVVDAKTGIASRFDRSFTGPTFAPWMSKLATVIDRNARLHFPLQVGLRDGLTHYAYQRYTLDGKKLDSIAVPMHPTARSSHAAVMIDARSGRMLKGLNVVPFHPSPVWTVAGAGTVVSSPADSYHLDETDERERIVRQVTRTVVTPRIPAAEREDSLRALSRRIDSLRVPLTEVRGMSEEVKARRLPTSYPVFQSLSTAFDGTVWARRWSAAPERASSSFDLLSPDGKFLRTVILPANCTTLPAPVIRGNVLTCVQLDPETDAESVIIATIPKGL